MIQETDQMQPTRRRKGNVKLNKSKKKKKLAVFILIISLIAAIFSILLAIKWIYDNNKSQEISEEINEITDVTEVTDESNVELINPPDNKSNDYWDFIKVPLINVDFSELIKRNKDTVGWINVNNTNINYPVVQTTNNEDYLDTAFDGSKNQAGWIFADYRNDMKNLDKNTVIYGHSRLNKTMFGDLFNVLNKSWYENKYNRIIRLSTPTENTMWQVFSIYTINPETYYITTHFSNDNSYTKFLNTIKDRSNYNFNVSLSSKDKIITLSTCSNAAGTGRIVLHAKLIKREARF